MVLSKFYYMLCHGKNCEVLLKVLNTKSSPKFNDIIRYLSICKPCQYLEQLPGINCIVYFVHTQPHTQAIPCYVDLKHWMAWVQGHACMHIWTF